MPDVLNRPNRPTVAPNGQSFSMDYNHASGTVRVSQGGRMYMTTPALAGMALLGMDSDAAATGGHEHEWEDHLATHGVAVGVASTERIVILLRPAMERSITVTAPATPVGTNIKQVPPMLVACVTASGRFVRGGFYMLNPATQQASIRIDSATPIAAQWPFGNVYSESDRICWGTTPTTGIRGIIDLENAFFGSGFNGDLYRGGELVINNHAFSHVMGGRAALPVSRTFTINLPTIIGRIRR